jgi:TonB family protein
MVNKLNRFVLIISLAVVSCSTNKPIETDFEQINSESTILINKDEIEDYPTTLPSIKGGIGALYKVLDYPAELRSADINGTVVFMFPVYIDGSIGDIIELSSPHSKLSEEVKRSLKKVKFIPATKDGILVNAVFPLKLTFALQK